MLLLIHVKLSYINEKWNVTSITFTCSLVLLQLSDTFGEVPTYRLRTEQIHMNMNKYKLASTETFRQRFQSHPLFKPHQNQPPYFIISVSFITIKKILYKNMAAMSTCAWMEYTKFHLNFMISTWWKTKISIKQLKQIIKETNYSHFEWWCS